MSEPRKIEPHYQAQGKRLVDVLFDKGYFSDTLSRDGMGDVEGLLALYLQLGAESAARCVELSKKFKAKGKPADPGDGGEDLPRHEEEMRWIRRARVAETHLAEIQEREAKVDEVWRWSREVGSFLKEALSPPYNWNMGEASRLFADGITLGVIPEPDCRPVTVYPPDLSLECGNVHEEIRCSLRVGHFGPHRHGQVEWK